MFNRKGRVFSAVLAGVLGMGWVSTASAGDSPEEIRAEMQRLQAKLDQLEAKQTQTSESIQKMIDEAARRSQLLVSDGGVTAGYDEKQGGFFIQDSKGEFKINPYFQFQLRHNANFREGADGEDDDVQNGFEIRRMKFGFKGVVFKDFEYNFRWASGRAPSGTAGSSGFVSGGSPVLEDAYIQYGWSPDFKIRGGQFKSAVVHEETTSSGRLMAVDRTLLNELLGGGITDWVQGAALLWNPAKLPVRGEISVHDGLNTDNTNFTETGGTTALGVTNMNWGAGMRAEWFAIGNDARKQYDDFTALGNKSNLLVVGAGADWSQGGDRNILAHSVDVQYENARGLGLYAAYVGTLRQFGDVAGDDTFYDFGFVAQASYLFTAKWEAFARYDITFFDDGAPTFGGGEDTIQEITVGVNYYMHGHRAKFTVDLSYLPDGAPTNETGIGVLASEESQWVLRGQFQLLL